MAQHLYEGHLHPVPPFEFEYSHRFIQARAIADLDASQPHTLALVVPWQTESLLISLHSLGKVESPLVLVKIQSPFPLTEAEQAQIHAHVYFRFGLAEEIQPLYTLGWDDDPFADILEAWYGFRQVKFASPWAAACWGWLQGAADPERGAKLWARLLSLGPGRLFAGRALHCFPTGAQLIAAGPELLGAHWADEALGGELWQLAREFPGAAEGVDSVAPPSAAAITAIQAWLQADNRLQPATRQLLLSGGLGLMATIALPPEQILAAARPIYGPDLQLETVKKILLRYESWQGYWYHYLALPPP